MDNLEIPFKLPPSSTIPDMYPQLPPLAEKSTVQAWKMPRRFWLIIIIGTILSIMIFFLLPLFTKKAADDIGTKDEVWGDDTFKEVKPFIITSEKANPE